MEQLFGAIPEVLKELGPNAEIEQAVAFAAWKKCAGAALSERTLPIEFFENRLVVAVRDDIWRRHLEDLCPQMVARINGYLGGRGLRFIEFRVEPKRFPQDGRGRPAPPSDATARVPHSIVNAAENIADPSLRASFLEAAAEYLDRQRVEP